MSGQPTRISRKIRQGNIDVDPEESALVVNFTLEVVNMEENGRVLEVLDSKPDSRRIKIRTIAADRNLADMASEIIEKCKYIHPSRVEEVEQLLIRLSKIIREKEAKEAEAPAPSSRENHRRESRTSRETVKKPKPVDEGPPASMDNLDDYLELLYQVSGKNETDNDEGLRAQIQGTAMILKLCRVVVNLEILIQNNTVMGALTRVLQEEFKKSSELTFNILRIFLAFSNFLEMHRLMASYSIGILTMKAIEFEFKRTEHRSNERAQLLFNQMEELNQLKQQQKSSSSSDPSSSSASASAAVIKLQEKHRTVLEKHDSKIKKLEKKQAKVLFVGFYILLNLAEDPTTERRMIKRGLLDDLLTSLDHRTATGGGAAGGGGGSGPSEDLLMLTISFLLKLSIYEENKNYLKSSGSGGASGGGSGGGGINIITKLSKFLPCSSQPLMALTLRLIYNLSFDPDIREACTQNGYLPKLINLLRVPMFRGVTIRLLYHLSVEDRCKSMFTYAGDGIPLFMGMIINFPQNLLTKELAGLAINVSLNPRNAEIMAANRGLNHLIDRLLTTKDPLLMKIIRNLAQWSFNTQAALENPEVGYKFRGLWSPHIKNLCKLVTTDCDSHDLLLEILGTFANLTTLDLPMNQGFSKIFLDFNLLSLLNKLLIPGMAQNDIVLEVILIFSTAASDGQCCKIIMKQNLIPTFYQLWREKGIGSSSSSGGGGGGGGGGGASGGGGGGDVEIMLQLLYLFYKLLLNEITQEEVLYGTRVIIEIIECLHHPNRAVRALADQVVELVLELDRHELTGELGQLGLQIRKQRFESYNEKWLLEMSQEDELAAAAMGGGYMVHHGGGYEDEEDSYEGGGMGGGGGGGYGEEYIARQYVNDEEHDEDMAWRAMRLSQQQQQQGMGMDVSALDYSGYGSGAGMAMAMGSGSPGTLSSDGDGEEWNGRRQYK